MRSMPIEVRLERIDRNTLISSIVGEVSKSERVDAKKSLTILSEAEEEGLVERRSKMRGKIVNRFQRRGWQRIGRIGMDEREKG